MTEETKKLRKESDFWLAMCIEQGYVPATCDLPGQIVFILVNKGEDPCAGCNVDRNQCHGRPRGSRYD